MAIEREDHRGEIAAFVIAGLLVAVLLFFVGCASQASSAPSGALAAASPMASPTPNLEAVGMAALAEDRRKLDQMGQVMTQCMNGVQKLLALCPHVPKSEPFDKGVNDCLKEARAHERK
jgi:hypothetical protein